MKRRKHFVVLKGRIKQDGPVHEIICMEKKNKGEACMPAAEEEEMDKTRRRNGAPDITFTRYAISLILGNSTA